MQCSARSDSSGALAAGATDERARLKRGVAPSTTSAETAGASAAACANWHKPCKQVSLACSWPALAAAHVSEVCAFNVSTTTLSPCARDSASVSADSSCCQATATTTFTEVESGISARCAVVLHCAMMQSRARHAMCARCATSFSTSGVTCGVQSREFRLTPRQAILRREPRVLWLGRRSIRSSCA